MDECLAKVSDFISFLSEVILWWRGHNPVGNCGGASLKIDGGGCGVS
jgi:hypothetical protein